MKTFRFKSIKISSIGLVFIFGAIFAATITGNSVTTYISEYLNTMTKKAAKYLQSMPEDRVYLQLDKTMYKPGETIWFSAYVRNASDFKPSLKSEILYVDLINPKGAVEKTIKLVVNDGQTTGDFELTEESAGGLYKLKAYTQWQKNDTEPLYFEKEIQVQKLVLPRLKMKLDFERKAFGAGDEVEARLNIQTNENKPLSNFNYTFTASIDGVEILKKQGKTDASGLQMITFNLPKELKTNNGLLNVMIDYEGQTESISRSIPILLNKVELSFYPEGGDLVSGISSKLAFRALNEYGKPADIEGVIKDSKGNIVNTFTTFHNGMGATEFQPQSGETYKAFVTKPVGVTSTFEVPEALNKGYVMQVNGVDDKKLTLKISSTHNEKMSVVMQIRGNICYKSDFQVKQGENELNIPVVDLPIGVAQITLLDSKSIERCERLAFVNKTKQMKVEITTDKQQYLPREKVKLTIRISDENGMPIPAHLSLSVVDDQLLSFADDKSSNILSHMLVEADIKGKVEEPKFYFDANEPKADQALDYLLMTSGWRRFTWKQISGNQYPNIQYQGERAVIAGTVFEENGKPCKKATIRIPSKNLSIYTNDSGRFEIKKIDLSESLYIEIGKSGFETMGYNIAEYSDNLSYNLHKPYVYNTIQRNKRAIPAMMDEGNIVNAQGAGGINRNEEFIEDMVMDFAPVEAPMVDLKKVKEEAPDNNAKDVLEDRPVIDNKIALAEEMEAKLDMDRFAGDIADDEYVAPVSTYYRAREFAAPVYDPSENVEKRTDFRSTIFWKGNIVVDKKGKAVVEFFNNDAITSFRAIAEGFGDEGSVGRNEFVYFTQLPFSMSVKVPVEAAMGDLVNIPLTLKNNTTSDLKGKLKIQLPEGLEWVEKTSENVVISGESAETLLLKCKVINKLGKSNFDISFESRGLKDAFVQDFEVVAKGYPVTFSGSGQEMEKNWMIDIKNPVNGSMKATLTAYPSVTDDLLKGIESILCEPYGCFEQTSSTSYPNLMVLNYMKTVENPDNTIICRAKDLLSKGYKRLVTFETPEKGYEWFGGAPGHEALTAYGLLQFTQMKEVNKDVDQGMIDRTAKWLLARRDNKGGFERNSRALDSYGSASQEITNAYIVYALSEAGYNHEIQKELEQSIKDAKSANDPYLSALVVNALLNLKDNRATEMLKDLVKKQEADGKWNGLKHSITCSTGQSLQIETTSLVLTAILKSISPDANALNNGVKWLISQRSVYGGFGSSQSTIMALKALTEYAKFSKKVKEDGTLELYVDGKKVKSIDYKAGESKPIEMTDLQSFIADGKHTLTVKFANSKASLPYTLAITYNTFLPQTNEDCKIDLKITPTSSNVKVGEIQHLDIKISNKTAEGLPMTMALVGIPAGCTVQPWQLKELMDKKLVDFYEIRGNRLMIYYRQMKPSEVRTLSLDLKAEISGTYDAPASCAYLYYTNELKTWTLTPTLNVSK